MFISQVYEKQTRRDWKGVSPNKLKDWPVGGSVGASVGACVGLRDGGCVLYAKCS